MSFAQPYYDGNWSIFTAMHDVIRDKELKKVRMAKCLGCSKFNFYRLKSLDGSSFKCKSCNTKIVVEKSLEKMWSGDH